MIGIVVSRFNEEVTSRLLKSCLATLKTQGIKSSKIKVAHVPGAYEIPWAAQEMALSKKFKVIITLGAILKGETPQNDYIAQSTISHLHKVALKTRIPCILGVITPATHEQAMARTRGELDRGKESALAAIACLKLRRELNHG